MTPLASNKRVARSTISVNRRAGSSSGASSRSASASVAICARRAASSENSRAFSSASAAWSAIASSSAASAGEKTRPDHLLPAPEIQTVDDPANYRVIALESLISMKLMSNRRKDQVHILDLIAVRLIDRSWLPKLPPELAARLKQILDTPDA